MIDCIRDRRNPKSAEVGYINRVCIYTCDLFCQPPVEGNFNQTDLLTEFRFFLLPFFVFATIKKLMFYVLCSNQWRPKCCEGLIIVTGRTGSQVTARSIAKG